MRRVLLALMSLMPLRCGEAPAAPEMRVGFRAHALACDVPGLQAWLKVQGVEGVCPLEVAPDRTVSGTCGPVPGGRERVFRIEYSVVLPSEGRVRLASANITVDLRETTEVDFRQAEIITNLDDDGDGRSNIVEFCAGGNPRDRDG
jgi:hypothetical protein